MKKKRCIKCHCAIVPLGKFNFFWGIHVQGSNNFFFLCLVTALQLLQLFMECSTLTVYTYIYSINIKFSLDFA